MYRLWLLRVAERALPIPPEIKLDTIHSINDVPENCGTDYRFRARADLRRVMNSLRLPPSIQLSNGLWIGRERALFYISSDVWLLL